MDARRLILRILETFDSRPTYFEGTIDATLNNPRLDGRDKRFIFEIVYGVIRRKLTLDYMIDHLLSNDGLRQNATLRQILRMGLYQLLYLDRVPDHAAVNESVNLAKSNSATMAFGGVVNAVLRRVIADRRLVKLPGETAELGERLSVEYSHPRWMVERWLQRFGLGQTRKLLSYNNERPDIFLRRRLRGISRQQFEAEVHALCDPAMGFLNLYYRLKKNIVAEGIDALSQGLCNVQAPSSGWVVALMDAARGDKILDVCSSPGGKTALLSELIGDNGSICACDDRWSRILLTTTTIQSMRLTNVHTLLADGRNPPFAGVFDKVIVDAPCSATGILQRHPDARWIRKLDDIAEVAGIQAALLDAVAGLVRVGGSLVYSTCSIEPEENEEQIRSFLERHPEFEHAGCPESVPARFIDGNGFLAITPFAHGMDGMFGARLRRNL